MRFFFITNSPDVARYVADNGVDRLFVDLELLGKVERQGHLATVISRHTMADVAAVRAAVPDAELMVRLNPVHPGSRTEVEGALSAGADVLMLPMFRTVREVEEFCALISRRCRLCLLVETGEAMAQIAACASVEGVDEVHIGLNDLSLDLDLGFMFQPFPLGMVDRMAAELRALNMPFGVGGLARSDEGLLPARRLIGEHVRIGSTASILSRTFHRQLDTVEAISSQMDFAREVTLLRQIERDYTAMSPADLERNRAEVWEVIRQIEERRLASAL